MIGNKKSAVVGGKHGMQVVHAKRLSTRKFKVKLVTVIASLVLIALITGIAWVFTDHNSAPHTVTTKQQDSFSPAQQKINDAILSGNTASLQQQYESDIANAKTPKDKANAYITLSANFSDQHNTAAALQNALLAEQTYPTATSAEMVGDLEVQQGDKVSAAKYYNLALQRLDKQNQYYGRNANRIQAKLNGVTG